MKVLVFMWQADEFGGDIVKGIKLCKGNSVYWLLIRPGLIAKAEDG